MTVAMIVAMTAAIVVTALAATVAMAVTAAIAVVENGQVTIKLFLTKFKDRNHELPVVKDLLHVRTRRHAFFAFGGTTQDSSFSRQMLQMVFSMPDIDRLRFFRFGRATQDSDFWSNECFNKRQLPSPLSTHFQRPPQKIHTTCLSDNFCFISWGPLISSMSRHSNADSCFPLSLPILGGCKKRCFLPQIESIEPLPYVFHPVLPLYYGAPLLPSYPYYYF